MILSRFCHLWSAFQKDPYDDFSKVAIAVCELGRHQIAKALVRSGTKPNRATGNFTRHITTYLTGNNQLQGDDFLAVWGNWAFWELIQELLAYGRAIPTSDELGIGWKALSMLLPAFRNKPTFILGLGKRMEASFMAHKGDNLSKELPGLYLFSDESGAKHRILFVLHPSWRGLTMSRIDETHKIIERAH